MRSRGKNTYDCVNKPYLYLKNLKVTEKEIEFYNKLLSINDIPCRVIIILIDKMKNDGFDISDFQLICSELLTNNDCFFVFKSHMNGKEFYALYDDINEELKFGYCDKNGEQFNNCFTISYCLDKFDKNYIFSRVY